MMIRRAILRALLAALAAGISGVGVAMLQLLCVAMGLANPLYFGALGGIVGGLIGYLVYGIRRPT